MKIVIKYKNKKILFDVSGSTTIRELKDLLSSRIDDNYKCDFFFGGELMEDDESLDYYGVKDHDII